MQYPQGSWKAMLQSKQPLNNICIKPPPTASPTGARATSELTYLLALSHVIVVKQVSKTSLMDLKHLTLQRNVL